MDCLSSRLSTGSDDYVNFSCGLDSRSLTRSSFHHFADFWDSSSYSDCYSEFDASLASMLVPELLAENGSSSKKRRRKIRAFFQGCVFRRWGEGKEWLTIMPSRVRLKCLCCFAGWRAALAPVMWRPKFCTHKKLFAAGAPNRLSCLIGCWARANVYLWKYRALIFPTMATDITSEAEEVQLHLRKTMKTRRICLRVAEICKNIFVFSLVFWLA